MTHADLVKVGARWLRRRKNCGVVLVEHVGGYESPDAIGWKTGFSFLVECKVSRSDYYADRQKASRASIEVRPADYCWYLTPPRLLSPGEIIHGWGLLEYDGRCVRQVTAPPRCEDAPRVHAALRHEVYRLYCELRRYQAQGIKYLPLTAPPVSAKLPPEIIFSRAK